MKYLPSFAFKNHCACNIDGTYISASTLAFSKPERLLAVIPYMNVQVSSQLEGNISAFENEFCALFIMIDWSCIRFEEFYECYVKFFWSKIICHTKRELLQQLYVMQQFSTMHTDAFCQFSFQLIYYYGSNKSTGKETGKSHLCAMCALSTHCNHFKPPDCLYIFYPIGCTAVSITITLRTYTAHKINGL